MTNIKKPCRKVSKSVSSNIVVIEEQCPYCDCILLSYNHDDSKVKKRDYFICNRCGRKFSHLWSDDSWIESWQ